MVQFLPYYDAAKSKAKYAVIAARYKDKWVFSRHKERTTWEIPGGRREDNEGIEDTAKRELFEETGAIEAVIKPVCLYSVSRNDEITYGALYYADILNFAQIPANSEIAEINFFDYIPSLLTYPEIQPNLFHQVQNWLNLQSNSDELWDVLDENRIPTGRVHRRGDFMQQNDYHLIVHVWIRNSKGEFLITKRSPNKGFPNMWEVTGGSAVSGDDSITAAIREVKEETGISLDPNCGKRIHSYKGDNYFADIWLFKQDFELKNVVLQNSETCDKKFATFHEITELYNNGKFVPYIYLDIFTELNK